MIWLLLISFVSYFLYKWSKTKKNITFDNTKIKNEKYALSATVFWDRLDVNVFKKNLECFSKWVCPYCGEKLSQLKSNSFKCSHCKNKIHRRKEILSQTQGLFTEQEKETLEKLRQELQSRKKFWSIYKSANDLVNFEFSENKQKNIENLIIKLHFGQREYYKKKICLN